ncbi:Ldh family oxidoreductase [Microbacterium sp. Se5.02b]|nr:Ldh family oxidoreductase [Microbacterium sp. Se5.02b]
MNIEAEKALAALRDLLRSAVAEAEPDDVALAALWVLQAEMLDLPEFGIRMLRRDLDRLADLGRPGVTPSDDGAAIGSVDATGVPGVVALATGVRRARRSVEAHGLAIVGIRGAGALGILGLAARSLAADGTVALLAAQSPASVAPWGAHAAAIGTNPLALGSRVTMPHLS